MVEDYKDRLASAMKRAHVSIQALADELGISYQAVRKVLRGETKSLTATNNELAAAFLRVPSNWLATGKGSEMLETSNVTKVTNSRRVPIVSWQQEWSTGEGNAMLQTKHEVREWVATYNEHVGDSSFALQVSGDAMVSPHPGEESFPPGTLILVDPSKPVAPGDYVLAKDKQTGHATFKRLVQDAGRWYLKPSNPAYQTVEVKDLETAIIGRVMESQQRRAL
jgi:SOS-response transcriptional repressor LexA